jgi:CRP-like cAMP-binding protein
MAQLTRIPLFKDAGIDLTNFERRCIFKRVEENEILVDFEDSSSDVYFILSGEVRILLRTPAGKEIIFGEMRAGQFFGEFAAIDGTPRSANVTALTRTEICIMPPTVYRELVFHTPLLVERQMKLLTARVRELNARLMEHAVLDLRHRLYSELLRLSVPRTGHAGERVVTPPPYHHVLAARIGCRREQVTREFTTLDQENLVEKTRGAIILKKPHVLEERIRQALREGE